MQALSKAVSVSATILTMHPRPQVSPWPGEPGWYSWCNCSWVGPLRQPTYDHLDDPEELQGALFLARMDGAAHWREARK